MTTECFPLGCFPTKGLTISLPRNKSKSSNSNSTSSKRSSVSSPVAPKQGLSREEELKEVFHHFDSDNDGRITAFELRAYFSSIGEYMSLQDAQAVIDDLDTDEDHMLDIEDFVKLMNSKEDVEDDLKTVFEMFEYEKGSGRITPKGLQRMLNRLGDSKSFDECAAMIQIYDIDGDGELDFQEFHQMMV